jgi:hypothetical protein
LLCHNSVSIATIPTVPLAQLPAEWRSRLDLLRWHGAEQVARTVEALAEELERALQAQEDELLTLNEAAAASGFSSGHLGRDVRAGRIPNAGRPNAPRIRRGDLPKKSTTLRAGPTHMNTAGAPRGQIVRAVVNSD